MLSINRGFICFSIIFFLGGDRLEQHGNGFGAVERYQRQSRESSYELAHPEPNLTPLH